MFKYKLTLSYDGTSYGGWQIQPNALSIQEVLEKALSTYFRESLSLVGSGRTDAGVHALGQVAHFSASLQVPLSKLVYSLNGMLPKDIRVISAAYVTDEFHAQYSAIGKVYMYKLFLNPTLLPFHRLYCLHIPYSLDLQKMEQAARFLLGTHDFSSFANHAFEGSASKNPVRTLKRIDFLQEEPALLTLEFEGNGFLYKMVRNIVGTLLEVGAKKIEPEKVEEILLAKDRKQAKEAAPAWGLFLKTVHYAHTFEVADPL